jgi:hypothetical protein
MTVYEKNTGGLVTTGQRSVTFFPSGLMRVDQLYVCKTGEEGTHRATLGYELPMPFQTDGLPYIDGLFIFPEVQESKDGTGFTNFQCSGYGRTTDQYRELSRGQDILTLGNIEVFVYNMTGIIVKRNGEAFNTSEIEFDESFLNPVTAQYISYPFIQVESIIETNVSSSRPVNRSYRISFDTVGALQYAGITLSDPITQITAQRNFGKFVEYEFSAQRRTLENLEE